VTDADLEHLTKEFTQLQDLELEGVTVTDAGLEHLEGLRQLQGLGLEWTPVTDAGLEHLKRLTQLHVLGLSYTKVTDEGVKRLQQALPNCMIFHYTPAQPPHAPAHSSGGGYPP
jgi:Leucine-rich repeat (LRR) protein